jgi:TrpR-related protein YerC/YecD
MPEDRLKTPGVDDLLAAITSLESRDETYALLLDLCTIREIHDMAQRLHVARLLAAGEHYARIQEVTGASATTISRVSKCLNYGAEGYLTVIQRLWPDEAAAGPGPASESADAEAGR